MKEIKLKVSNEVANRIEKMTGEELMQLRKIFEISVLDPDSPFRVREEPAEYSEKKVFKKKARKADLDMKDTGKSGDLDKEPASILIRVNTLAARRFSSMTEVEKESVSREFSRMINKRRTLKQIMKDMSEQAERNGLTPEILDELLKNE